VGSAASVKLHTKMQECCTQTRPSAIKNSAIRGCWNTGNKLLPLRALADQYIARIGNEHDRIVLTIKNHPDGIPAGMHHRADNVHA